MPCDGYGSLYHIKYCSPKICAIGIGMVGCMQKGGVDRGLYLARCNGGGLVDLCWHQRCLKERAHCLLDPLNRKCVLWSICLWQLILQLAHR